VDGETVGSELVGAVDGETVGSELVGEVDGETVGSELVGAVDGETVGSELVGETVGDNVGSDVVGEVDGETVGFELAGAEVGEAVGSELVGEPVGDAVGSEVVGASVGDVVGSADVGETLGLTVGLAMPCLALIATTRKTAPLPPSGCTKWFSWEGMPRTIAWSSAMPAPDPGLKNASRMNGSSALATSTTMLDRSSVAALWPSSPCNTCSSLLISPCSTARSAAGLSEDALPVSSTVMTGIAPVTAGLKVGDMLGLTVGAVVGAVVGLTVGAVVGVRTPCLALMCSITKTPPLPPSGTTK